MTSCKKGTEIGVFEGTPGPNEGDTAIHNTDRYRLTRILNFGKSDSEKPGSLVEFTYDSKGNLTKETLMDYPDRVFTYFLYAHENGRLIKKEVYDGSVGALARSTTYTYSYEGDLLVKEQATRSDNSLIYSTHYVYQGRRLMETYKWDESLGKHHHYKNFYDNRGNMVRQETYMYYDELASTEKYDYDALGRRIKTERFDHQNRLETVIDAEYTGNFMLPWKEVYRDSQGNIRQTRTYALDIFGNQTQINLESNTFNKKKYYGKLLREEIRYSSVWGFQESGMTRYEYQKR
jgi:hypothetical protein